MKCLKRYFLNKKNQQVLGTILVLVRMHNKCKKNLSYFVNFHDCHITSDKSFILLMYLFELCFQNFLLSAAPNACIKS